MTLDGEDQIFLAKAIESLASARSELDSGRYNACANRCYFACFQAAVGALIRAGIIRSAATMTLPHSYVQSQFAGQLIHRRKQFPGSLRDTLNELRIRRENADYKPAHVSRTQAERGLRRASEFVAAVELHLRT